MAVCTICERRKGKRTCPAKGAKICSQCCGEHRERRFDCPFSCAYLEQAHEMEPVGFGADQAPFPDVRIADSFLREHAPLVAACARGVALGAGRSDGALDLDAREALDVQVETFRTLSNGIFYEAKAKSPYARTIAESVKEAADGFRETETEETGVSRTRDEDVMRALVVLRRLAEARGNSRPRSRRFLHFLAKQFPLEPAPPADSPIILPGR